MTSRLFSWMLRLERWINRQSQAILTSSTKAKSLLREEFGIDEQLLHPLPDCADPVRFDPARIDPAQQAIDRK